MYSLESEMFMRFAAERMDPMSVFPETVEEYLKHPLNLERFFPFRMHRGIWDVYSYIYHTRYDCCGTCKFDYAGHKESLTRGQYIMEGQLKGLLRKVFKVLVPRHISVKVVKNEPKAQIPRLPAVNQKEMN